MICNLFQLSLLYLFLRFVFCVDPNVLKLTDNNFAKRLQQNEHLLAMFFIPWSGLSQKLRPHFARAANVLKKQNLPVALGKMDCSGLGRRTCGQRHLDHHFPLLHLYSNATFVKEYTGSRDTLGIVKFMRVQVLPGVLELKSVDEFKKFLQAQEDVVVVGFFEEESKLRRRFFRVAEQMKEWIIFAYTSCERVLMKEGVTNGIVLFRTQNKHCPYEDDRVLFKGRDVIGEIKNFIIENYYGIVGYRNPSNVFHFTNPQIILYYTVDHHSDGKEEQYWRNRILKVAHKYRSHVKFVTSVKDDFEEELAEYTVDYTSLLRPFVLAKDLENKKYVMQEEFSSENFERFTSDFVHGNLKPHVKSKPIPLENDGAMVIAVADNFQQTVINNDKDTLLDLYVPWSYRGKKLSQVMREVADLLLQEDVVVARMDIRGNEIPELFVERSVPNLYWLPKYHKEHPIMYQGEEEVDDLIKFIVKQSTDTLRHYDRNGNHVHEKNEL